MQTSIYGLVNADKRLLGNVLSPIPCTYFSIIDLAAIKTGHFTPTGTRCRACARARARSIWL